MTDLLAATGHRITQRTWLYELVDEDMELRLDRLQIAAGDIVDVREDGTGDVTADLHAIGTAFDRALRQIVWVHEHEARFVGREGVLLLDDDVVLHDVHDPDGIHLLVYRSLHLQVGDTPSEPIDWELLAERAADLLG